MVDLVRTGSTVPVSTHQVESTVLATPLDSAWSYFKSLKLEVIAPGKVTSTEFTSGAAGQIDAILSIQYADGAKWELRIVEISELEHSIGYQVLSTEPSHQVTSIQG